MQISLNCQAPFIKGRLSSGLQAKYMPEDIGDVRRIDGVARNYFYCRKNGTAVMAVKVTRQ